MSTTKTILSLFFLLASTASAAEEIAPKHPIDVWLEQHMSDDYSTAGMRTTTNHAREMWEAEMNKVYQRLMSKMNPTQQAALREAQRNWLRFREAEGKVIVEVIAAKDGTMYQLIATGGTMDMVRERTLKLIAYEDYLEE